MNTQKIRIGIVGYGNVSKGCVAAIKDCHDMELAAVFTRREPEKIKLNNDKVILDKTENINNYADKIDVLLLCMGSATDLPVFAPEIARNFCIVDSYDNHSKMPEYLAAVGDAAKRGKMTAVVGTGWDPGLFSLNRLYMEAALNRGKTYTFWGKGVSQGHSDAVRRVEGVKKGIQYTIPIERALDAVRNGSTDDFTKRQTHQRQCFVVAEDGADIDRIESDIKNMPDYFEPYNTQVIFIDDETFDATHNKMPHGGFVIRSGKTAGKNAAVTEFSLKVQSNPEFTGGVMVACARAAKRLHDEKSFGAFTMFDIPPAMLSPKTHEQLIEEML